MGYQNVLGSWSGQCNPGSDHSDVARVGSRCTAVVAIASVVVIVVMVLFFFIIAVVVTVRVPHDWSRARRGSSPQSTRTHARAAQQRPGRRVVGRPPPPTRGIKTSFVAIPFHTRAFASHPSTSTGPRRPTDRLRCQCAFASAGRTVERLLLCACARVCSNVCDSDRIIYIFFRFRFCRPTLSSSRTECYYFRIFFLRPRASAR